LVPSFLDPIPGISGASLRRSTQAGVPNSAPTPAVRAIANGRWDAAKVLQDTHIFRSTGFELLEHLHFDEIAPHLPAVVAEQDMARARSCARRHFPAD
jgi:NAD(P)H dehydrogenase (quinone)